MSETGFTTGGYFPRDINQIEADIEAIGSGVLEEINFGPGSAMYQIKKIVAYREKEIELLLQAMVSGLDVDLAYGDFLEKHGIEKGVFRKGPQKAGGVVHVTLNAPAPATTPYDLLGTYYQTNEGLTYYRENTGVSQKINSYIGITRGTRDYDYLPTPFYFLSGIVYQNASTLGLGQHYSGTFDLNNQLMNWSGVDSSEAPGTGTTYYLGISGYTVIIEDSIVANLEGTGQNVGANTVNRYTSTSLPATATVNNPSDITGGASFESDDDYRARIKRVSNSSFTAEKIRSVIEGIQGVRSAYVYQDVGTDKITFNGTWSAEGTGFTKGIYITGWYTGGTSTGDYVSGNIYGQLFTPGNGIMGLKRVDIRGKRVGIPPPLVVGLRNINGGDTYLASGIFDTYDISPPASDIQDMEISLKYLDLDATETYRLDFWCSEKSGASGADFWAANYWELITGSSDDIGNLGDGDDYTGLLYLGEDDSNDLGANLILRTRFGASAFNVDIAVKDGYNYNEIYEDADTKLDWVSGEGYAPIGVNYTIQQATPVYIAYSATVYLYDTATADITSTKARIDDEIEKYVEGLQPGGNVVYSQVYKHIINDPKIWRLDDLHVWEIGGSVSTGSDIHISRGEIAVFSGSTVNKG